MLVSSGLALSALGLAGGPGAQAAPAPTDHWCPGEPWNPAWGNVLDLDWNRCHEWQHPGGPTAPSGWGPWGPRRRGRRRSHLNRRGRRGLN
ncbi:putative secreted protein antigen [Mycobacterium intracellulare 1956]|uniref:Pilin n=1 Tax=Mycobacterium intracellulare 1956 TaxID=1299331 RepID=X8CPT6_MYCIT|nr:putative secreted protein antigen [Mycobacterium intracellulare]EUA57856.1 putative secreted protein antigen [Mycobacterium intracellulare 1956]